MNKIALLSLFSFLAISMMNAQTARQFDIDLWQKGLPNSNGREAQGYDDEKQNFKPSIRVFLPADGEKPSKAVIICPGGGYSHLALSHEGYEWAPFFNELNVAVVVLKYRMPNGNREVPISDALEALRITKKNSKIWNINPDEIGIMGFSAGGHLATTIATHAPDSLRPAFQILFYPVVTLNSAETHLSSRAGFLGKNPSQELIDLYSNELQVKDNTPTAFIALSSDDAAVVPSNSIKYYTALQQHKIPVSMHVYPSGGHGWGIRENFAYHDLMMSELKGWITGSLTKYLAETIRLSAPFPMPPVRVPQFPNRDFPITDFGAVPDGKTNNSQAIAKAVAACNAAGGGRVVVPAGNWLTGAIRLKSNVNLYLTENAELIFTDNPNDYLPAVQTSWEGLECFNYSPLVYAFECENIAITGKGVLKPEMDNWRKWFGRTGTHYDALKTLYTQAYNNVPVKERQMAVGENHFRPHLVQFNRCKNILLDSFKIRESPFWTIHLLLCENGVARNLDVRAHGLNNDGIDLEMTRNFLVEDCLFDQGDDAVVIKSGRNHDAWRLHTPTENIVVRNCTVLKGHCLLGIGSEISGGVRNVYMHDCALADTTYRLFYLKTNHRRGGFLENITMENVTAKRMQRVFEIDTDVLYQWRDLVPTYETRITKISDITIRNITAEATDAVYEIKGDARLPVQNIELQNITVGKINKFVEKVENAENVRAENIVVAGKKL